MANKLTTFPLAALAVTLALAAPSLAGDPDMLQDLCVADYKSLQGRKYIYSVLGIPILSMLYYSLFG
jgi:hypothetical protein